MMHIHGHMALYCRLKGIICGQGQLEGPVLPRGRKSGCELLKGQDPELSSRSPNNERLLEHMWMGGWMGG